MTFGPRGTESSCATVSKYEIQERVLLEWRGPSGLVYGWNHWSDVASVKEDGSPVTHADLDPIVADLARAFETDFRIVRVTTTTTVVCEEVGTTLKEDA